MDGRGAPASDKRKRKRDGGPGLGDWRSNKRVDAPQEVKLGFRCTAEAAEAIRIGAKAAGLPVAAFLRASALARAGKVTELDTIDL
jgi:hypothetical protein